MPRAEIKTEEGLYVVVEGSMSEVESLIAFLKKGVHKMPVAETEISKNRFSGGKKTLADLILGLEDGGFFDKPQGVGSVKTALEQNAHYYTLPVVSTTLRRLVQKGSLGRVLNEGVWCYVKR
ncbi:MAG: hypothetical protein PHY95_00195 [Candidatus ainarchaeum sp.]|nr:hypothetical protein [Candidatus ainarchaeum sp.]